MLRLITPIFVLSTLVGCCCSHPEPESRVLPTTQATRQYRDSDYTYPASALVFDPPIARDLPPLDLSRDARQPMAFVGFQQAATSVTYIRTDDRQSTLFPESYDRWTVTEQVGTSVR